MMEYVNLKTGEEVELTILWRQPKSYLRHWVGGRAVNCSGGGCSFCASDMIPRPKHILHVKREGREVCWIVSPSMLRTLRYVADDPNNLEGIVVKLRRQGTGNRTQYHIVRVLDLTSKGV